MAKKKKATKIYPNWLRIQALRNGSFNIYCHEPDDPRVPDVYEAKNTEELLVFLAGVYGEEEA